MELQARVIEGGENAKNHPAGKAAMADTVESLYIEHDVKRGVYSGGDCDEPCLPKVKVPKPKPKCVDPCADPCSRGRGWVDSFYTGIGAFILWFVVLVVLIWIIIFSLHPSWVMQTNNPSQVDTGKVLLASIVIALIIIIIVWVIKLLFTSCR